MTTDADHGEARLYAEAERVAVLIEGYGRECLRVLRCMAREKDLETQICLARTLLRRLNEATAAAIRERPSWRS